MLTQLSITNFTIVEKMDVDLSQGLSVITGETGAGKSIAMDALTFALGAKLDASSIRQGAEQCTISATFSLFYPHPALEIIAQWGLLADEGEYIFSRSLSLQGRSQARLNGMAISQTQLKQIGQLLVDIHGQHAHQRLLKADLQRDILDTFGQVDTLALEVKNRYHAQRELLKKIATLEAEQQHQQQHRDLLTYQLGELAELAPEDGEWQELDARHTLLSSAESLLEDHQHVQHLFSDAEEGNVLSWLDKITKLTSQLSEKQPDVKPTHDGLMTILTECREHQRDLARIADNVEMDPQALQEVSERVEHYLRLAKKHRTLPEELYSHQQTLQQQLDALNNNDVQLNEAYQRLPAVKDKLVSAATELTDARKKAANALEELVSRDLAPLNMPHAKLNIVLQPSESITEHGAETIAFLFTANPGQAPAPLGDVASGGELSRLSLVLQVAINGQKGASTLVFDEVDTGISGSTASVVGKLLKALGKTTQIISITHLPQVAACADHHFVVSKTYDAGMTQSSMVCMSGDDRIHEVARLLGAQTLTPAAIANAKELLEMSIAA